MNRNGLRTKLLNQDIRAKSVKTNIEKYEKRVLEWLNSKRYNVVIFFIFSFLALSLPTLPYLNFFIDMHFSIFLVILFALILFSIPSVLIVIVLASLLLPALVYYFLEEFERADLIANYIYGVLFIYIVKVITFNNEKKAN